MKKVLFISLSPHTTLGGTQNYNFKLMNLFKKLGWEITEYNCNLGIDKVIRNKIEGIKMISNSSILKPSKNRFIEGWKFLKQVKISNVEIAKLLKEDFDLIIDTRQHPYYWKKKWGKDLAKTNKMLWVQHFNLGLYDGKCIAKNFIEKASIYFYTNMMNSRRYNVLYSHKNIILFDKNNEQSLNFKRFKTFPNTKLINLSSYNYEYIKNLNLENKIRNIDFLYVGRINQIQKNIKFVNKVFKNAENKIIIIGDGDRRYIKMIQKNQNITYLGSKNEDELKQFYLQSKFLFIPSNFEGFPYTIVEALSHGCFPIILNTYESVNFFKEIAFIYEKNIKSKQMTIELSKLISNYDLNLAIKARDFALKHLTNEEFERKWIQIISKINN